MINIINNYKSNLLIALNHYTHIPLHSYILTPLQSYISSQDRSLPTQVLKLAITCLCTVNRLLTMATMQCIRFIEVDCSNCSM